MQRPLTPREQLWYLKQFAKLEEFVEQYTHKSWNVLPPNRNVFTLCAQVDVISTPTNQEINEIDSILKSKYNAHIQMENETIWISMQMTPFTWSALDVGNILYVLGIVVLCVFLGFFIDEIGVIKQYL